MINGPLLSIVTINKNDSFYENQLQRTKFILNYFIYSLKKINALEKVEYLIVDWGSNEPFSNYFYKEISMSPAIKFINVPKDETAKCKLNLDVSKALNIGIQNSSGEHVMLTGSDAFFPVSIFNNLLNILENPDSFGLTGDEYKLVPRKILEDDFFIYEKNMEKIDLYFQSLSHSTIPYPEIPLNSGGGSGGNLLKKKQWLQLGGIRDTIKQNRGQDLINLHESSKFCSHVDTATFGSFLLKLPRTKSGYRQSQIEKVGNQFEGLTFEKNDQIINSKKIQIINNKNLPKKKIDFKTESASKDKESITAKGVIKTIVDCSSFANFYGTCLQSQDIRFILKIKKIIKENKLKIIILDESQASRFTTYLSSCFKDLKFIILIDPKKNTSLQILKFRTMLTHHIHNKNPKYYGHIKVVEFDKDTIKFINKSQNVCIIQEQTKNNFPYFKNEFYSTDINAIRKLQDNTRNIIYSIEGDIAINYENQTKLTSDIFINLIIFTFKTLFKIKRILGKLKRKL